MSPLDFFHTRLTTWGKALLVALALCALLLASFPSQANSRNDRDNREQREQPDRRQEQARARISASQAADLVQRQYGGKIMNVQTRNAGGRVIYSVKILSSSGHMRTVSVDGQSGSILN